MAACIMLAIAFIGELTFGYFVFYEPNTPLLIFEIIVIITVILLDGIFFTRYLIDELY